MNRILIGIGMVALAASAAGAQILGGGGAVDATAGVGGVTTQGSAAASAGADIGPNVRGTVGAVTDAGDAGTRAASDSTTMATHAADASVHSAAHVATGTASSATSGRTVTVKAGARTQVTRETRCYDGTDYYDPYFSDGSYYCEGRSTGAGVAVKAKAGG